MIRLERVTKIYPDGTVAVKDMSFEVKKGELCVLLGPSGCGKTTTMKMINRLIPVTSGKIYIDGVKNTDIDGNELRRNIGYAIQDIGLFPHMTVGENIETVPALKGWPKTQQRKRAKELLELLRMDPDEFIDKYPRELSGGQRQRVGVARSLGGNPPILLMDEPFGALDPITRVELQEEFLKIQQEIQKTIIFVTHDIYEAIKIGDQIALMKEGQLVQYASPAELLYRPKDEFVAGFVGADRALKGLQLIRAKEVMLKSPPTAKPDEKAEVVRERMDRAEANLLAVVDDEGRFMGWVGAANLETNKRVRDIMGSSTTTATRNAVLNEALSLMLTSGLNVLAIVDKDNKLEGILSFEAIQEALRHVVQEEET
ncbi:MAG: betaine/proline/choline family ABC transporter ATP-binding protein [Deltaproteobacteria bacterium]|nr:betaine/proline/choline family ABC transporter ATP-binding protein [Deltaproteobacteria bacterium]